MGRAILCLCSLEYTHTNPCATPAGGEVGEWAGRAGTLSISQKSHTSLSVSSCPSPTSLLMSNSPFWCLAVVITDAASLPIHCWLMVKAFHSFRWLSSHSHSIAAHMDDQVGGMGSVVCRPYIQSLARGLIPTIVRVTYSYRGCGLPHHSHHP